MSGVEERTASAFSLGSCGEGSGRGDDATCCPITSVPLAEMVFDATLGTLVEEDCPE